MIPDALWTSLQLFCLIYCLWDSRIMDWWMRQVIHNQTISEIEFGRELDMMDRKDFGIGSVFENCWCRCSHDNWLSTSAVFLWLIKLLVLLPELIAILDIQSNIFHHQLAFKHIHKNKLSDNSQQLLKSRVFIPTNIICNETQTCSFLKKKILILLHLTIHNSTILTWKKTHKPVLEH